MSRKHNVHSYRVLHGRNVKVRTLEDQTAQWPPLLVSVMKYTFHASAFVNLHKD